MGKSKNFEKIICQVQDFYGQQTYSSLGPSIAQKKKHIRILFFFVQKISRTSLGNLLILLAISLFYLKIWKPEKGKRIFQFAPSRNNVRVFTRLNKILVSAGISDISLNGTPLLFVHRLWILIKNRKIRCAVRVLMKKNHENPFIHVQQAIGCSALLIYPVIFNDRSLKIICVANDHLPACMALLVIAREKGIATCYVQHAPVTEYFPPLNYDLSVLFDRSSLASYQKAALRRSVQEKGRVIYLPPFDERFYQPTIGVAPYIVGVCLSFLPNLKGLKQLLSTLSRKDTVSEILLRRHPRCRQDLSVLSTIDKVSIRPFGENLTNFFEGIDIVLVPNSGIAIEALHSGRCTFYTPAMDMLEDDYYGFVGQRIVPVFEPSLLEDMDRIQSFFGPEWKERFSMYDETINSAPGELEKKIVSVFEVFLENSSI